MSSAVYLGLTPEQWQAHVNRHREIAFAEIRDLEEKHGTPFIGARRQIGAIFDRLIEEGPPR